MFLWIPKGVQRVEVPGEQLEKKLRFKEKKRLIRSRLSAHYD